MLIFFLVDHFVVILETYGTEYPESSKIDASRESSKLGESGAPLTEKLRKTQLYSSYKKVRIDFSRSALLKEL